MLQHLELINPIVTITISISSCRVPRGGVVKEECGPGSEVTHPTPSPPLRSLFPSPSDLMHLGLSFGIQGPRHLNPTIRWYPWAHAGEWSGDAATNACFFSRPALFFGPNGNVVIDNLLNVPMSLSMDNWRYLLVLQLKGAQFCGTLWTTQSHITWQKKLTRNQDFLGFPTLWLEKSPGTKMI